MLCIIVNFYCVTLSDQFCCIWLNLTRVQPCTLHDSSYFYQQSNHQPSVMVILKVGTITLPLCCLTGDVVFFGSWAIALFSPSFWYCWTLFHLSKGLFVITVQALLHVSDKLYPGLTVSKCNQWFAPSCWPSVFPFMEMFIDCTPDTPTSLTFILLRWILSCFDIAQH